MASYSIMLSRNKRKIDFELIDLRKTNPMVKYLLLLVLLNSSLYLSAQYDLKPSTKEIETLPEWAQLMYSEYPNVWEVDRLYENHYREHLFVKSYHTQYYKRWRRSIADQINDQGFVGQQLVFKKPSSSGIKSSNWSVLGPLHVESQGNQQGSKQSNIYSLDRCESSPNVLYCGTEPGEVYKSTDGGNSWATISMTMNFGGGVTAVECHPTDQNTIFAGGDLGIFRSQDGGLTWTNTLSQTSLDVNEILVFPNDPSIVFAATGKGLYRSTNGGTSWTNLFTNKSYDIKAKTDGSGTLFLVRNNPTLIKAEFYISTDNGATWAIQSSGWYNSTDPNRLDGGARIAVSPSDPSRVYAYLIGQSKADDFGYIGVYRSNDGGFSWMLPNGPDGGPYTDTHLNLAYGNPGWTYHQGFYNCAIMADPANADRILIGGLNLYRSDDGGNTFSSVAGYVGGPLSMHVDMQDFRSFNNEAWITTDGGIYRSSDFFTTNPTFKMDGVHASDYWGFGSGWNEDVLVGGLYHNGNLAYHENYGNGNFRQLGGGEAPTGYVNTGINRKTYFSDIGGKILPLIISDPVSNFSIGLSPNESYWSAESSEMEFHPNCYNIAFLGKDHKIWKTIDGGGSFNEVYTFGTSAQDKVKYIEISSSNPDVIYVTQQPASGSIGKLWKTTNGGVTWDELSLPAGNSRKILLSINPENENELYMAYASGANGQKVYVTNDGGSSWTNITSSIMNSESIHSLLYIAGTNGALYAGTGNTMYYRDQTGSWSIDDLGLPEYINTNILKPFYRDGKVRMASYGKGLWESDLNEVPDHPIARINVDKFSQTVICEADSFYFEDHSFLNHTDASWSWSFPTGAPSNSTTRNPVVYFPAGTHQAILTITDGNGLQDSDTIQVTVNNYVSPTIINEDFQGTFLPDGWLMKNWDENGQWEVTNNAGGFGNSSMSALFRNYDIDSQGTDDDLSFIFDATAQSVLELTFDVAYTPWGGSYSDSLSVLISTDCGTTYEEVYFKGGTTLATAPTLNSYFTPNSSEWRNETIDLNSFGGNELLITFRNHGHWGNNLYLDNINLSGNLSVITHKETNEPMLYPNPICPGEALTISWNDQSFKWRFIDLKGKTIAKGFGANELQFVTPDQLTSGIYFIQLESEKMIRNLPVVIR